MPNFLAPTPSRGRPLPHQKISGLKSLGLGSFLHLPHNWSAAEKKTPQNLQSPWPLTGVIRALGARNTRKGRKKVLGASRPRGQKRLTKSRKKVKNESKTTCLRLFQPFSTFFDPGAERPRELSSDFWGISGPKGPNDPCKGPRRL